MEDDLVLCMVLFGILFFALFYIYFRAQQRIKESEMLQCYERSLLEYNRSCGRQENDVWNISGRVNNTGTAHETWPTHDHHVSIDSFVFPPEYQAKDPKLAPPPYTEVDLPSYEEAISAYKNENVTSVSVPIDSNQSTAVQQN